jgi:TRAP-type uncharacterized transport system fused permease subunit
MRIKASFWRILFYIAAFGTLATLIRKYPQTSLMVALIGGQLLPSLVCCGFFAFWCKDRKMALLHTAGGAVLGWLLCPTIEGICECQSWLNDFARNSLIAAVYAGVGAFVAGAAVYAVEFVGNRLTSQGRRGELSSATPDSTQFWWRLPLLWCGSCGLILAAVLLAAQSMHFHEEYGQAIARKSGAIGPSPEPFFQRAEYTSNGIVLVCIIALILTLMARHAIPLWALIICIAILVYTKGQVDIRI